MTSIICNFCSICIDCDCNYSHFLPLKERRVVRSLYNNISNIVKTEENPLNRKANCKFGQLCHNKDCGYRHRLSYNDRNKLIESYKNSKFESIKVIKTTPVAITNESQVHENSYKLLEIEDTANKSIIISIPGKKTWAEIVDNDEFYMNFD